MPSLTDLIMGTKSTSQTTQQPTMSPEQSALLKKLLGTLDPNAPAPSFSGSITAPQNPVQGASLAAMEQAALNAVSPTGDAAVASGALKDVLNQTPMDIQKAIIDPAMQTFKQQILPDISRRFSGMSGFGSDRILQEGIASGNVTTGLAQALEQARQQELQTKIGAATGLSGVNSANVSNILGLSAGGNAAMTAANTPSAAYQAFLDQQQLKQNNLNTILAALGIKPFENVTTVTPGTSGLIQGAAGGVGTGLGMAAGKALL